MDAAVKAQWTAALRSGKYEQGLGYLRKGDRFCCLGVLCDLAVEAGVECQVERDGDVFRYDQEEKTLPHSVSRWASLDEDDPFVYAIGPSNCLGDISDLGTPFGEIADLVDERL